MSEFQYYEFYAIERELTRQERNEIDQLSSRFSPTSRRAVFNYSYSSFKHNEEDILLQYFDFLLYLSSWGTKRVMYKLPLELVNYKELKKYACSFDTFVDNEIRIYKESKFVLIDIKLSEEDGGFWVEDNNYYLSSDLIGLRQDILNGDYRSLFILWLHMKNMEYNAEELDLDTQISKQLIPHNLDQLNSGLKCLMELFHIDEDWVSGAAKYSIPSSSRKIGYAKIINALSTEKKNEYLIRILDGELNLNVRLKKEIEKIIGKNKKQTKDEGIPFKELLNSIHQAENKRKVLEKKEAEIKNLNSFKVIENNKKTILKEINDHINTGRGKSYDEALVRILKLRDLAIHKNEESDFKKWIDNLKKEIAKRTAMIKRINDEKL